MIQGIPVVINNGSDFNLGSTTLNIVEEIIGEWLSKHALLVNHGESSGFISNNQWTYPEMLEAQ